MSKSFSMTGWRLGWVAGRRELIGALSAFKTYLDAGPLLAVQRASVPVLERAEAIVRPLAAEFERRRDAAVAALAAAGLRANVPKATPYLWVRLPAGTESRPFALRLLDEEAVVVLPGAAFGAAGEGFVRIALAEPPERIADAAGRIGRMIAAAV
jgi:LL-diaminopimelate aminotransferase